MINFRFHLVSLIAVFLALAVGVVMGYGVLGQPTVDTLQHRVDTVEARANHTRAENGRLRAEQRRLESALQGAAEFAVTNRIGGTPVLTVAARGVDDGQVTETVRLARRAGGLAPGILWLEDKWNLESLDDVTNLATILGVPPASRSTVREAGLRALAARLASGPPTGGKPDVLTELASAGFVASSDVDGIQYDLAQVNGRGASTLLVGGTDAKLDWSKTLAPLGRALVDSGQIVVIAADDYRETDNGPARGEELAAIRGNPVLAAKIPTVDDLDVVDGPLTTVLVMADRRQGTIAHYGFGAGAGAAMPSWWLG